MAAANLRAYTLALDHQTSNLATIRLHECVTHNIDAPNGEVALLVNRIDQDGGELYEIRRAGRFCSLLCSLHPKLLSLLAQNRYNKSMQLYRNLVRSPCGPGR